MVGRRLICGVWRILVLVTNGSYDIPRQGISVQIINKKKINGKRSTEIELIGLDGAMSPILWSRYFIEAQGYNIAHN